MRGFRRVKNPSTVIGIQLPSGASQPTAVAKWGGFSAEARRCDCSTRPCGCGVELAATEAAATAPRAGVRGFRRGTSRAEEQKEG